MKDRQSSIRRRVAGGLLAGALLMLPAGCAPSFTFGTPAKIDQLTQLQRGASRVSDVRRVLGEPRGTGATRLPAGYRNLWLYDSGDLDGGQLRMRIRYLIIFFDGESYDGYLWFDIDTKSDQSHTS